MRASPDRPCSEMIGDGPIEGQTRRAEDEEEVWLWLGANLPKTLTPTSTSHLTCLAAIGPPCVCAL